MVDGVAFIDFCHSLFLEFVRVKRIVIGSERILLKTTQLILRLTVMQDDMSDTGDTGLPGAKIMRVIQKA